MSLQYITHTGLEQSWHFLNWVKGSEITWLTTAAVRNTKNVWSNDGGLFFLTFLDFRPPYLYWYEGLKLSNQLGSYFLDPSTKYVFKRNKIPLISIDQYFLPLFKATKWKLITFRCHHLTKWKKKIFSISHNYPGHPGTIK